MALGDQGWGWAGLGLGFSVPFFWPDFCPDWLHEKDC